MTQQREDRRALRQVSSRSSRFGALNRRRRVGSVLGSVIASLALAGLLWPGNEHWSAPGPMNTGHEQLTCDSCHQPAPGTARQQLQANARFALGLRAEPVDFGERSVENADCLSCHERRFDRHPVSRFTEPRFEKARAAVTVQHCEGCHREHSGMRVTSATTVCENCHADIKLRADPLDVSHETLARDVLGCHDFHGNHVMKPAEHISEVIALDRIEAYLRGGKSPYPAELRMPAKRTNKERD
jgi:hypothetical protein